jgi:hypothetical protein
MTVQSLNVAVSYAGNGVATSFAYDWLIAEATDIDLTYTDATGTIYNVSPTGFTVNQNLNADGTFAPGGTVMFMWNGVPAPDASTILISRYVPPTQSLDINPQDGFNPQVVTAALDRAAMVDQQLTNAAARALSLPLGDPATGNMTLPGAALRANNIPAFDPSGNLIMIPSAAGGGGGGGPVVPTSAPLLGSTAAGSLTVVQLGSGLSLNAGTLTATAAALPPNAALMGTDDTGAAAAVALGTGISVNAGTLTFSGAEVPVSAALLASNASSSLTALTLGAGLQINSGTISTVAASLPANALVLGTDSSGNPLAISLGFNLTETGGALHVNAPNVAQILNTDNRGRFAAVTVGPGLTLTGQNPSSGGGTLSVSANVPPASAALLSTNGSSVFQSVVVGAGLLSAGGTLSATTATLPINAALLATNSGGAATAVALGSGVSITSGTLNVAAATLPPSAAVLATNSGGSAIALILGAGLTSAGGTLSASAASIPANAAVLASNSGGTVTALVLGAGLASSGGTLSNTAASLPASAQVLATNSSGVAVALVLGTGIVSSAGTLSATAAAVPTSAALLASDSGANLTSVTLGTNLSITSGTLNAAGTALTAGADIAISSGTISVNAPSAALLASGGGALTAVAVGSGLAISSGTLSASGTALTVTDGTHTVANTATLTVSGSGTISGSVGNATLTIGGGGGGSLPSNAALLGTNSSGTAVAQSVGAGLTLSAGTLSANAQTPPLYFSGHTGTLTASETVWRFVSLQNMPVPSGFAGWNISSKGTATANTTLTLLYNGTSAATVVFSAGADTSAITGTGGFSMSIGDEMELQAPASPDTSLAQIFSSLAFGNVFATSILNPFDKNASLILSGGNLIATGSGASYEPVRSAPTRGSGLLYFEFTINNYDTAMGLGIANSSESLTGGNRGGDDTNCAALVSFAGGMRFNGTTYFGMPGATTNGAVICFAVNFTSKDIWVRVNGGLWNNDASADPAAGTHGVNSPTYANGALTSFFGTPLNVWASMFATSSVTVNFGGTAFAETVPAGYSAWE